MDVSENRLSLENETSARLRITFVDMTYPDQRPQYPSQSSHFLLSLLCSLSGNAFIFDTDQFVFFWVRFGVPSAFVQTADSNPARLNSRPGKNLAVSK